MNRPITYRRRRSGVAIAELALVLPFTVTLAAIGSDLSRAVAATIVVANAARSGAEYGSMHRFVERTRTDWEREVRDAVLGDCDPQGAAPGDAVSLEIATRRDSAHLVVCEVTARYDFRPIMPLPTMPNSILIERTATMRQIR